jgi:LuxR family maltose regulon positive regulatory protein
LFERLSALPGGGVALVTGPAGSGKTLLLESWMRSELQGDQVAWVSVGRDEHDAQRFWLAVIDELAGIGVVDAVTPAPSFRGAVVVERLASELDLLEEPVVLVIDDLHELRSRDALDWLELLLSRLPAQLRLVLATRQQPALGLHRLRLKGRLVELDEPELRFSLQETRELLDASGVTLSDEGLATLHERTEGWVAGVRLAAISLARHPDPERFVTEFSGSERTVAGYLLAEVLEQQPPEVRDLLLRTSVLERVCGPLADALTGRDGSERALQQLEEANAFVTALDEGRTWFRYHHLFADLLRLELRRTAPALVESLHRTAAAWHEAHGDVVDAIRHAQAARDWPGAGRLLAAHYGDLLFQGRLATLIALLDAFPSDASEADAEIALACGATSAFDGLVDEAAAHAARAEHLHHAVPRDRRWFFDVRLASVKLLLARRRGDRVTAAEQLDALERAVADGNEPRTARDLMLSNDLRAAALMNLGIAELWSSRLQHARRHLEHALELARRSGRPWLEVGCLAHLAMLASLTGQSASLALDLTEQAVGIAEAHGWSTDPMVGAAFAIGGEALVRLGRFEEAERWLNRAERALGPDEPETELVLQGARGLLRFAQGRVDEALAAFRAAQRMQTLLIGEHALTVELAGRALQAQVQSGDVVGARAALAELDPQERDQAAMRIAAAAVHLAEGEPELTLDVVEPVAACSVEALRPRWSAIDALLFAAAARDRLGDRPGAEASIERALELAAPDRLVLPFALAPVRPLLERHPRYRTAHAVLLVAILDVLGGSAPRSDAGGAPAAHDLSAAELRVVTYLPTNLKAPEIAAELYLSNNTVRTHLRHIYAKLGAHSRNEAVARARDLGLLSSSRSV